MQNLTFEITYFIIGLVFVAIGLFMIAEVIKNPKSFTNKKLISYSILSFLSGAVLMLISCTW